jgi:hypothetical protein
MMFGGCALGIHRMWVNSIQDLLCWGDSVACLSSILRVLCQWPVLRRLTFRWKLLRVVVVKCFSEGGYICWLGFCGCSVDDRC